MPQAGRWLKEAGGSCCNGYQCTWESTYDGSCDWEGSPAGYNRRVMRHAPQEVIFKAGQLVQVYRSDLDYTFLSAHKMKAKWLVP